MRETVHEQKHCTRHSSKVIQLAPVDFYGLTTDLACIREDVRDFQDFVLTTVLLGRQICSFPMRSRGSVINIKCFLDL
ncbi:uncharacterized protein PHALS_02644 [Plasmopara halstedii]|uniref:Uncharacterized protein n=1 Tax=Plasmopara halstedii TaxID=4781 RepID=A0A0P1AV32_PLAHL|nr:uncharacterized protein PHALS_02644 [Plasmopara halstedii]CEG46230.1 hypothetical protein PHALS_02644 [Plasmopara halstedii]|eukprot:XP_024582599.1 hypothetical protein PHALS_02644 [Plasmopara halstedii]